MNICPPCAKNYSFHLETQFLGIFPPSLFCQLRVPETGRTERGGREKGCSNTQKKSDSNAKITNKTGKICTFPGK
jgi:hypothetical protein